MRVASTSSSLSAPVASNGVQPATTAQPESAPKAPETKQTTSKNDKLDISSTSAQLTKSTAAPQDNQFRADKVAEVKKAIETNDYQVSSRAVAEKMLYSFSRGPTA